MEITIDVKGIKEVNSELQGLPSKLKSKVLKAAYRKAAQPLITAIRNNVPVAETSYKTKSGKWIHINLPFKRYSNGKVVATYYPENLKKSIGIITPKGNKNYLLVGPRSGRRYKYDGYYGHMIERGTKHNAAHPFMRPGLMQARKAVESSIAYDVKTAIKKFVG